MSTNKPWRWGWLKYRFDMEPSCYEFRPFPMQDFEHGDVILAAADYGDFMPGDSWRGDDGAVILHAFSGGEDGSEYGDVTISDEHGRLLAASPQLLAALEEITQEYVDLVDSGDCGNGCPAEEYDYVKQARAAIAQAKAKS